MTGNLIRNTCPVKYACGGTAAYWSESKMPTKVGMTKIYVLYESLTDDPVTGMDTIVVLRHILCRQNAVHKCTGIFALGQPITYSGVVLLFSEKLYFTNKSEQKNK